MQNGVFRYMRTAKALISLRTRAVWSGPSLSTNWIIGHYRMYHWRGKSPERTPNALDESDFVLMYKFEDTVSFGAAHFISMQFSETFNNVS